MRKLRGIKRFAASALVAGMAAGIPAASVMPVNVFAEDATEDIAVSLVQTEGGKISSDSAKVKQGGSIGLSAEPEPGYRFSYWKIRTSGFGGENYNITNGTMYDSSIKAQILGSEQNLVSVEAVFIKNTLHNIDRGGLTDMADHAEAGEVVTLGSAVKSSFDRAADDPRYSCDLYIRRLSDDKDITSLVSYDKDANTFVMPDEDVQIDLSFSLQPTGIVYDAVDFESDTFAIENAAEGVAELPETAEAGQLIEIETIQPEYDEEEFGSVHLTAYYKIERISDGRDVTADLTGEDYTDSFVMPHYDVRVSVAMSASSATPPENNTGNVHSIINEDTDRVYVPLEAREGEEITIYRIVPEYSSDEYESSANLDITYRIERLSDGSDVTSELVTDPSGERFIMPDYDVKVIVSFPEGGGGLGSAALQNTESQEDTESVDLSNEVNEEEAGAESKERILAAIAVPGINIIQTEGGTLTLEQDYANDEQTGELVALENSYVVTAEADEGWYLKKWNTDWWKPEMWPPSPQWNKLDIKLSSDEIQEFPDGIDISAEFAVKEDDEYIVYGAVEDESVPGMLISDAYRNTPYKAGDIVTIKNERELGDLYINKYDDEWTYATVTNDLLGDFDPRAEVFTFVMPEYDIDIGYGVVKSAESTGEEESPADDNGEKAAVAEETLEAEESGAAVKANPVDTVKSSAEKTESAVSETDNAETKVNAVSVSAEEKTGEVKSVVRTDPAAAPQASAAPVVNTSRVAAGAPVSGAATSEVKAAPATADSNNTGVLAAVAAVAGAGIVAAARVLKRKKD